MDALKCVFQANVEVSKKEESFDREAQLSVLSEVKDIAHAQLSGEVKDYNMSNFGDVDAWITTQIESSINTFKNI